MSREPWHLNKSVPISFIFAIMCQTVALIWFVAALSNDVANNKDDLARLEERTQNLELVAQTKLSCWPVLMRTSKGIREFLERNP
jgi:hypothetical protein